MLDAYCRERWDMGRNYANRQIAAAQVIENLVPIGTILPATESQARPLTKLPAKSTSTSTSSISAVAT